jgi:hypothetical protein
MSDELRISLQLDQLKVIAGLLNELVDTMRDIQDDVTEFGNGVTLLRAISIDMLIIRDDLGALRKQLRMRRPGLVGLKVTQEVNNMLRFVLVLPPIGASDVIDRELMVQISGQLPAVEHVPPSVVESGEYEGNDGDSISGHLVDIDDAGNRSEPSPFSFTLADTIAPPAPGEIGIRLTGEN